MNDRDRRERNNKLDRMRKENGDRRTRDGRYIHKQERRERDRYIRERGKPTPKP